MIPRLIHQLWINPSDGSADGLPAGILARCRNWAALHPGFIHKIWSLGEVLALCRSAGRARAAQALADLRIPASQADLARLLLLREFGGFWADLKLQANEPFLEALLCHDVVLAEHFPKDDLPDPNGFLINSFMGSAPDHPFINESLEAALRNIDARLPAGVYQVTGPMVLNIALPLVKARMGVAMREYVVPWSLSWGKLFSTESGDYNRNGMHWSEREQREGIYLPSRRDTAVITTISSEIECAPFWYRYYAKIFGRENLYVIDAGPAERCVFDREDTNVIRMPRGVDGSTSSSVFTRKLRESLLCCYDSVICIDIDEILVADPRYHADLREFCRSNVQPVLGAIGLEVVHRPGHEAAYDPRRKLLAQRSSVVASPSICKPVMFRLDAGGNDLATGGYPTRFDRLYLFKIGGLDFLHRHQAGCDAETAQKTQSSIANEPDGRDLDIDQEPVSTFIAAIRNSEPSHQGQDGHGSPATAPSRLWKIPQRFHEIF